MREIKFRAWEEFENGGGRMLNPSVNMSISSMHGDAWWQFGYDEPRPIEAIVMQYTGLKDKNGKEIYEGDIMKTYIIERIGGGKDDFRRISVGFIDFRNGCFQLIADDNKGNKGLNRTLHGTRDLEIIGNIYENPNLLK